MTATNPTARLCEDILAGLRAAGDSAVGDMTAEQLLDAYDGAFLAEVDRLRAERDAWRDQRNAVFTTNEKLLARVDESDRARLLAENEMRKATCELDRLRAELADTRARALNADRATRALVEVRRLCELTIAASVRVQAIDQARDTLALIDRVMGQQPSSEAGEDRG